MPTTWLIKQTNLERSWILRRLYLVAFASQWLFQQLQQVEQLAQRLRFLFHLFLTYTLSVLQESKFV